VADSTWPPSKKKSEPLGLDELNIAIAEHETLVEVTAPAQLNPLLNAKGYDLFEGETAPQP
jgi:hypothetical protein